MATVDQFIITLWFLPVVISIIIPLGIACAHSFFSILKRLVLGKEEQLIKVGLPAREIA